MRVIKEFPRPVRCIEHTWIPVRDGARLAARIFLPEDAEQNPVPAVFEYIPYRKRDHTRTRDDVSAPYIAGHGYAYVRVDLRGSGDSEGVLRDEYLEEEIQDGLDVIEWIAEQPWSDGNVGMIGISWGGFNGLQIAARRPPRLKAIITVCSSDDRYLDDVHYMGGCLLTDNLSWASTMFAYNSCPPDPEIVGDAWRRMWFDRLEGSGLWLEDWIRHQHRDSYWRRESIAEDYSAIHVPVMAVSGWADGYSNAVFRLLENLSVPRQGLIGPWGHRYPHQGMPGPAIGFLQEEVRWWDHWMKGIDRGVEKEPMLRAWMQDSVPPTAKYETRPGRWVGEPTWPSTDVETRQFRLGPGRLVGESDDVDPTPLTIQSPLTVGLFAGKWCAYSWVPDLPHDQRQEDGGALTFDSDPLEEDLEILGAPVLTLEFRVSKPVAMVAVRLSDVAPDDKATRITYGLLNLTHRNGHEYPQELEPGEVYQVQVRLNDVAQSFPKGHRLRVAISTSYWPLAWAPPESVRMTVNPAGSCFELPVRPHRPGLDEAVSFEPAVIAPPPEIEQLEPPHHTWRVTRDLATDESILEVIKDEGLVYIEDIGLTMRESAREWYTSRADDFESLEGKVTSVRAFQRGDWAVESHTTTVLTASSTHFHIHAQLDAYEGEQRVYSQNWDHYIPREMV